MDIKVSDIKEVCFQLLKKLESYEDYELTLSFTTYWTVPFIEGQQLDPPKPSVNDIRDEWKHLKYNAPITRKCSENEFEELGNLFRAIGEKIKLIKEEKSRKK